MYGKQFEPSGKVIVFYREEEKGFVLVAQLWVRWRHQQQLWS